MRQFMHISLIAALLLAVASNRAPAATAQAPQPTPAMRAAVERQTQQLTQELALSAEQQGRLRQVLLLTRQHMDADRTAHTDDPAALRVAMAYDRAKSDELIRGVLTPVQYARYQQYKAQRIGQLHEVGH